MTLDTLQKDKELEIRVGEPFPHYKYLQPVQGLLSRPKWSVMIPTYNCARYLRETLTSVLQQDPGPSEMEIVVVDDGSTDNPEGVVKELGNGRVQFFQQDQNVGHIRNFETALQLSTGTYIHLLHGDDRVLWGFYKLMGQFLDSHPEAGAAFCRHYYLRADGHQMNISMLLKDESGLLPSFFDKSLTTCLVQTPSIAVRRQVYETVGMFDHRLVYTEDYEMWTRIGKYYPVGYVTTPLAEYRIHNSSHTARTVESGKAVADQLMAMEVITGHCPERKDELRKIWFQTMSQNMLTVSKQLLREGKGRVAMEYYYLAKPFSRTWALRLRWYKLILLRFLGKRDW